MKINKIPYSLLSLEAVLEMAVQSVETIASRHPDDALLSSSLADMDAPKQAATLAVGSSRKQELTGQINDADRVRDRGFIGFRKHVEADQYNDWNPTVKSAAENILNIIQKHGTRLHEEGLTVQSALMMSLFEDLEADQAKADLTTLNLTGWVDQLKVMQSDFAILFQQRNELETAKDIPTKTDAKAALVQKLSVLFNGLEFLAMTQPDGYAATSELVTSIATRIVTSERSR